MNNKYFCMGLIAVIILAKLAPSIGNKGGLLKPEITSKYFAVCILFLNNGLRLPTETLKATFFRFDVHIFIQGFTFIMFPTIMYILVSILRYSFLHSAILDGMMILSLMPPPVSSAIFLTRAAGGNVAAALFNSAFGSLLGTFITPSLILMLYGDSGIHIPKEQIFYQLVFTVMVPLAVGQVFRNYALSWLNNQNIPFNEIGQFLLFFIIYTTFCANFSREMVGIDTLTFLFVTLLMLVTLVLIQMLLLWFSNSIMNYEPNDAIAIMFTGSHKNSALVLGLQLSIMVFLALVSSSSVLNFDTSDISSIVYCGTHKSITLGIPVIDIVFEGNENISFLSMPLLIYAPMQIIFGGMTVGIVQSFLQSRQKKRILPTYHSKF